MDTIDEKKIKPKIINTKCAIFNNQIKLNSILVETLQQNNNELKLAIDEIKDVLFLNKIISCCYYLYNKCKCNCNIFFNNNDTLNIIYYKKSIILKHLKQLSVKQQNAFNKITHQHFTLNNFIIYLSSELSNVEISIDCHNIKYVDEWFN
jgi:hypothetical protein